MTTATHAALTAGLERDRDLCRSLLYEALSLGLRPPDAHTLERLADAESVLALAEAAALLDEARGTDLAALTRALAGSDDGRSLATLTASYQRLFGHVARGPIPPYETEYGSDTMFQKPQELSDVSAFLKAFGLTPDPRRHERIDHIACELEFLAFMARKEAHAREIADASMLESTRQAVRMFLRDHLGRFAPSFARRVRESDAGGFYGRLASLCLAFVTSECSLLKVSSGPETLRLRLPLEDRTPLACGVAGGCGPGAGDECEE